MTKHFVFGYINPDMDGIGSSIGYAEYLRLAHGYDAVPAMLGKTNSEIDFVLDCAKINVPETLVYEGDCLLYIVDTHQLNQLPPDLPRESVVSILDHHPSGNPEAFPNAKLVNEKIGAVATLIVEMFIDAGLKPSNTTSMVLYAAIISNTLDFKAPTTTERDKKAAAWLLQSIRLPADFVKEMFDARSDVSKISTKDVLLSDYKEFNFSGTKIGISQIESTKLDNFLARNDLCSELLCIRNEKNIQFAFLNGADINENKGIVVVCDESFREVLRAIIPGIEFHGDFGYVNRILLRKSDLIPQLTKYYGVS